MRRMSNFILLLTISIILTKNSYALRIDDFVDKLRIYQTSPPPSDCNKEATLNTLKFLSLDNDELKTPGLNKSQTGGLEVDCSLRKTNLNKLRYFLEREGYLTNPGSLHFTNGQDSNLKLTCSQKKSESFRWRSKDIGETTKDDSEFNETGTAGNQLNIVAPLAYRYFRQFICHSTIAPKCKHTVYVITRPHPKIQFPLHATEKSKFEFTCEINKCSTMGCQTAGGEKTKPKPQPPYDMQWRVHPEVVQTFSGTGVTRVAYSCKNEDGEVENNPIYVKVIEDGKLYSGIDKYELVGKGKVGALSSEYSFNATTQSHLGIKFSIEETSIKHQQYYECVVIDVNGVPSTPTSKSLHSHKRFEGRSKLHVRTALLTTILVGIIVAIFFLMFIVWIVYRKNDRMEGDDGQMPAQEEVVSPEEEDSSPAGETQAADTSSPVAEAPRADTPPTEDQTSIAESSVSDKKKKHKKGHHE